MKKIFSTHWKSSKKPRKQRKYRYKAPLHIKHKFMRVHLSKELMKEYQKRNTGLRKGDKVKIVRGQFRKKDGKIERIDLKKTKAFITGIEKIKKDGTKTLVPIDPSNLIITELELDDKIRQNSLQRKNKK